MIRPTAEGSCRGTSIGERKKKKRQTTKPENTEAFQEWVGQTKFAISK